MSCIRPSKSEVLYAIRDVINQYQDKMDIVGLFNNYIIEYQMGYAEVILHPDDCCDYVVFDVYYDPDGTIKKVMIRDQTNGTSI